MTTPSIPGSPKESPELAACPFCGSTRIIIINAVPKHSRSGNGFCEECACEGPYSTSDAAAIWNRRSLPRESAPKASPEQGAWSHESVDAALWAKEFMRLFGHRLHEVDESLMIGWFANAIMAGWDESPRRIADWALERWDDEVAMRPLVNIHRRTLDVTWRQVYRRCRGVEMPRPTHDETKAAETPTLPRESAVSVSPSDEERKALAEWCDAEVRSMIGSGRDPSYPPAVKLGAIASLLRASR